jgi:hypothetical protein
MANSTIGANYFHAKFTPENRTLSFDVNGDSQISSNVTLQIVVLGYGYTVFSKTIDPCDDNGLTGICPMRAGSLPDLHTNTQVPAEDVRRIPGTVAILHSVLDT